MDYLDTTELLLDIAAGESYGHDQFPHFRQTVTVVSRTPCAASAIPGIV